MHITELNNWRKSLESKEMI